MDAFELEKTRIYLVQNFGQWTSDRQKFFAIHNYFKEILSTKNTSLYSAFIPEFLEEYADLLGKMEPFYFHPQISSKIIELAKYISKIDLAEFDSKMNNLLDESVEQFTERLKKFKIGLTGISQNNISNKTKFPIIDRIAFDGNYLNGFLETVSLSIKKTSDRDNFILVPSGNYLEQKIEKQLKISWEIAIDYLKQYKTRISQFHEVIISFDKKYGFYSGDSLGIALTIAFIEQLLKLYNTNYLVSIKPGVTITGGINRNKKIIDVSEEIVKGKTEIVFYSDETTFVVPKNDEEGAKKKYLELATEFPERELNIIGIENLDDLFNRRNIIGIRKQNAIEKSVKRVKRHWKVIPIIFFLMVVIGFFLYKDYDDNPAFLESTENTLFVKNKVGKVLWTRKMGYYPYKKNSEDLLKYYQKIVDIDNDGINEVILANEAFSEFENDIGKLRIVCFDKNKNERWSYKFRDKIAAQLGEMDTNYASIIVDTLTIDYNQVLICIATNSKSFSSAIYMLDLQTGERLPNTLWNSGFFTNGIVKDLDNDGKKELVASFCNNGFEQVGILQVKIDNLNGQCPTTKDYNFKNLHLAELDDYILFPKTDYTRYINQRIEGIPIGQIHFSEDKNKIYIGVELDLDGSHLAYLYDYSNKSFEVIIGNGFRVMRDSLVVSGNLTSPRTDTDQYSETLISQIKYWNGKEFVYRKDLVK